MSSLVRLGLDTLRARRACTRIEALERPLSGAIKRSMPWVIRKRVAISFVPPRAVLVSEHLDTLAGPTHRTPLLFDDKHVGLLVLDAPAIAAALDGALAGGGGTAPKLGDRLTAAQAALADRLAGSIVAALETAGADPAITRAPEANAAPSGVYIVSTLRLGEGSIALLVPAAAVDAATEETKPAGITPMSPSTLDAVELDVVAELGRVSVPFQRIAKLRVGDVLKLPLRTSTPARVHVAERQLFAGTPKAEGTRLTIALERHAA